ncbi:hypothetical protein [Acinetobacter pollinis]|uniref:Uracil-DNA glycosylase-like domain-containing protein n=1 Tax=Acinetobacter pollinis TaxID=2605270 RepID=A0ABU6DQP8_9GAMM|nr:hypothetical protein [Acinetobacter pollinis]MEB5475982.1 hypothetical protein [Acinetobacter pollinis]
MTELSILVESVHDSSSRKEKLEDVTVNSKVNINLDYLNKAIASKKRINLVIIGQDPYPKGATDIPFFKEKILETLSLKGSNPTGKYVFRKQLASKTIKILSSNCQKIPNSRKKKLIDLIDLNNTEYYEVAIKFLEEGILFLNTRYWVVPGNFRKCQASEELNKHVINLIIQSPGRGKLKIICLGNRAFTFINSHYKDNSNIDIIKEEHPAKKP